MPLVYEDEEVYEEIDPEEFKKDHRKSLVEIGHMCLECFFRDKEMHYGGPISRASLASPLAIKRLFETDIISGVDRAYDSMFAARKGHKVNRNGISAANQLILDVLKSCANLRIPKRFRGGILLLYLELCHGIKII